MYVCVCAFAWSYSCARGSLDVLFLAKREGMSSDIHGAPKPQMVLWHYMVCTRLGPLRVRRCFAVCLHSCVPFTALLVSYTEHAFSIRMK